ncbi:MAG: alanine racemase [Desulfitobacteriia bacterium]|jgi:alanine racemase
MADLWIEIDLDAVKHNYRQVVSNLEPSCKVMAVVKADAYGLGAIEVARALEEEGCSTFAVTNISEAVVLRQGGIEGKILVLGPSSVEEWPLAVQQGLELTIAQLNLIPLLDEIAAQQGLRAGIHLKIETGFGRAGFTREMLPSLAEEIKKVSHLEVLGAYTHLARGAQREHEYSRLQHQKFISSLEKLAELGVTVPSKHICNSAGFLDFPEYHYDFVRIGTLLGGHFPSPAFEGRLDLQDPWKVLAKIVHLQKVPKGTYVGYQSLYKTKQETTLAVIPIGYADGFGLEPKLIPQGVIDLGKIIIKNIASLFGWQLGREKVTWRGKPVRIAGKIGMQLTVIDVGDLPCQLGDQITLPLRRTCASARITRIYKKNGEFYRKRIIKEGFSPLHREYFSYYDF